MSGRTLSDCCDAITRNGVCTDCKEHCETYKEYDCETCEDTGEVTTTEQVYAGEPHTAPIGTGRCPDCCGDKDDDAELDQDR